MGRTATRWTVAAVVFCAAVCAFSVAPARAADEEDDGRSYVYTNANHDGPNFVESLVRDKRTGRLRYLEATPTGGQGDPFCGGFEQHAVVTDGDFLYVVNPGPQANSPSQNGTISSFQINDDGSLDLLNVVSSGGRRPVALALHNNLLYVANQGSIPGSGEGLEGSYNGFRVRADGSLSAISNSRVTTPRDSSPADILISADGKNLVAMQLVGNAIDSFTIDANGRLQNRQTRKAGGGPFGASFSPRDHDRLFVTLAVPELFGPPAPGVSSYKLFENGHLDPVQTRTLRGSVDPCWIQFTHDGRHAWIDTFIPRTLIAIEVRDNGRFSETSRFKGRDDKTAPKDPDQPGGKVIIGATDIALSGDGEFLYQLRAFSIPAGEIPVRPRIHVYRVTGRFQRNAGLAFVEDTFLPKDLAESGVMGLVVVDR